MYQPLTADEARQRAADYRRQLRDPGDALRLRVNRAAPSGFLPSLDCDACEEGLDLDETATVEEAQEFADQHAECRFHDPRTD